MPVDVNFSVEFPGLNNATANLVVRVQLIRHSGKDKERVRGRVIDTDRAAADGGINFRWNATLNGPTAAEQRTAIGNGKHFVIVAEAALEPGGGNKRKVLRRVSRGWKV